MSILSALLAGLRLVHLVHLVHLFHLHARLAAGSDSGSVSNNASDITSDITSDGDGDDGSYTIYATPHASYSSSIGVLGCKVDTDRIAYFPSPVSCSSLCVAVSHAGRELLLLRVDQSQGAHDMSFDAFNQLLTGQPATRAPVASGPVPMLARDVDPARCAPLLRTPGHRLPLSAANSINFLASCLDAPQQPNWVADNHVLYNICDALCTLGYDEPCALDWPAANQPACPHTLGLQTPLDGAPVYDVLYPSGVRVLASAPNVPLSFPPADYSIVPPFDASSSGDDDASSSSSDDSSSSASATDPQSPPDAPSGGSALVRLSSLLLASSILVAV